MLRQPAHVPPRDQRDPFASDLEPMRLDGQDILVRLMARLADDGVWRARLEFQADDEPPRQTAEIFCAPTFDDLWHSVRALGRYHLRDLFRSLA